MKIDEISGTHYYDGSDEFTDILFNGQSVAGLEPVGVQYNPITGYGYVVLLRTLDNPNTPARTQVDGQKITHTYYGTIQVII